MEKEEKRQKKLLTDNRMATVNKRETSFEGLVAQLENGEDGIYNIITDNKNIIFQPKISITKNDLESIPLLKQLKDTIDMWEKKLKQSSGKEAYIIKQALIEMHKEQYIIKNAYKKPIVPIKLTRSKHKTILNEYVELDENQKCVYGGVSLLNPEICSAILCNYSDLKQDSWGKYDEDMWYLIYDFENVCDQALTKYPIYKKIVELKIDNLSNAEIQKILEEEFNIKYSLEYISSLWRNKIPELIASTAEDNFLDYYYLNIEKGKYKKCTKCGKIKLAHNKYFSKNKTSKDGFYSICKQCRNSKKEG